MSALPLVIVNDVARNMGAQVFVDLFFSVSEKLVFVEWEEVAERLIMASAIVALVDAKGLPVAREELSLGDYQGGIRWWDPQQQVEKVPEKL